MICINYTEYDYLIFYFLYYFLRIEILVFSIRHHWSTQTESQQSSSSSASATSHQFAHHHKYILCEEARGRGGCWKLWYYVFCYLFIAYLSNFILFLMSILKYVSSPVTYVQYIHLLKHEWMLCFREFNCDWQNYMFREMLILYLCLIGPSTAINVFKLFSIFSLKRDRVMKELARRSICNE